MSAAVRWKFIDIELADFHPGDKWRTASSTAAVLFVKPAASPHRSPEKSLEFFLRSNLAQEELRENERSASHQIDVSESLKSIGFRGVKIES
jgi:hypothetical protein